MILKTVYRHIKRRRMMKRIAPYVSLSADSYYGPSFNADIRFPAQGHLYLETGSHCILDSSCVFESAGGHIKIGDRVHIGASSLISVNEIVIEDDVTIAWGCLLYDHNSHSTQWEERKNDTEQEYRDICAGLNPIANKNWAVVKSAPVHICAKAWLGCGVTVLKGVTIGEGAIVGAGSVVVRDVEPWTVVAGNPAQVVRRLRENNNHEQQTNP